MTVSGEGSLSKGNLEYRRDIDGLRAVAVLAVVGFHAFPRWFAGGFAGVDIFFVISGYLISLVIIKDLQLDKFCFRTFYARRVRRIFPGLVLVLIAILALGWAVLLGPEFRALGQRAAGGAGFVSNFLLLDTRGYFAMHSNSEPLLHLWSLGIEEQFYIVWPLLFYIAWKTRVSLIGTVALLTAASFSLNLWSADGDAFYLPTTRAWELGAGGLLALKSSSFPPRFNRVMRECMSAAGLLSIILAIFFFNPERPYPGLLTLAPVLGAALLIAAGNDAWLNRRVLSIGPLVGCGLISYPLYLWHWPLLSMGHILIGEWLSPLRRVLVVLASFILAFVTYQAIEKPLRFGRRSGMKALALVVLMFGTGCLGLMIDYGGIPSLSETRGVDRNLTDKLFAAAADWDFPGKGWERVRVGQSTFLRYPGRKDRRAVWFFGDSEVEQYGPRIQKLLAASPQKFPSAILTTKGGCPPLPNLTKAKYRPQCAGFFDRAIEDAKAANISTVVIGAAWPYVLDGITYDYTGRIGGEAGRQIEELVYRELEDLLLDLHAQGKTVYLLLPIPMGAALDPERMILRHVSLHPFGISFSTPNLPGIPAGKEPVPAIRARLQAIAARVEARVIDPYDFLCRNNFCPALDDNGEPIYKDESHIRSSFAREHATFIDRVLSEN